VPAAPWAETYEIVVDTRNVGGGPPADATVKAGDELPLSARSALLLQVNRTSG